MLEPRHGPIRSIFIRLRHAFPGEFPQSLAIHAVRISNDLYGSDVISAFEAAKGYSRPINPDVPPAPVDAEMLEAHANLVARRKLTKILRSHSLEENEFRTGDLVQIFMKRGHEKRGRWLSPRQVIAIDTDVVMVTVPGAASHTVNVALEDVRAAHVTNDITSMIQESIDQLDDQIEDHLESVSSTQDSNNHESPTSTDENCDSSQTVCFDGINKTSDDCPPSESAPVTNDTIPSVPSHVSVNPRSRSARQSR